LTRSFYSLLVALLLTAPVVSNAEEVMRYDLNGVSNFAGLFPKTGKGFTNAKMTYPQNKIQVVAGSGKTPTSIALSAIKRPSGSSKVSKSSLVHEGFEARQGDILKISFRIKINSANADGLYFLDLECSTCWPPIAPVSNQSPGIRMYLDAQNGRLAIDRGKIGFRSAPFRSTGPRFPVGEWVDVVYKIGLSEKDDGWVQVKTNKRLLLRARGSTLPNQVTFAKYGILLAARKYDYVEVGATANESKSDQDVRISNLRIQIAKGAF